MKPQEPIPHNYSMARLNLIFALSSLLLLGTTGAIVMYDYIRGWKWFQWEFLRLQHDRLEQDLRAATQQENKGQLSDLDKQVRDQEVVIAQHRAQYVVAQKELDSWEGKHYAADQNFRFAKANLDAKRYEAEAAVVQKRPDAAAQQQDYERQTKHLNDLQLALQQSTRDRDAAQERVNIWLKKIKDAEDRKKELTASIDLINKQIASVEPSGSFFLLNAPMLDFIAPTFKIDQVVLPDLYIDMNYMPVPRVDRCQTCHRAIDRPGFESKKEAERLTKELQQKLDTFQIIPEKRGETEERIAQLKRIIDAPTEVLNPWRTHPRLDVM